MNEDANAPERPAAESSKTSENTARAEFFHAALAIAAKDLRVEARAREVVYAMVFFAALVVTLFAFAFTREGNSDGNAVAGVLWIALPLTGTLGLTRALDREREGNAFRALSSRPSTAAPSTSANCSPSPSSSSSPKPWRPRSRRCFSSPRCSRKLGPLVVLLVLGTVGFAAVGSLFATMLLHARGREVLLGILLYPIVIPVLLAGTRGTQALLALPANRATAWFFARLILVFDAVFITLALWIYEPLVAEE